MQAIIVQNLSPTPTHTHKHTHQLVLAFLSLLIKVLIQTQLFFQVVIILCTWDWTRKVTKSPFPCLNKSVQCTNHTIRSWNVISLSERSIQIVEMCNPCTTKQSSFQDSRSGSFSNQLRPSVHSLIFCNKLAFYGSRKVTKPDFRKKNYLGQKWTNRAKQGLKFSSKF